MTPTPRVEPRGEKKKCAACRMTPDGRGGYRTVLLSSLAEMLAHLCCGCFDHREQYD